MAAKLEGGFVHVRSNPDVGAAAGSVPYTKSATPSESETESDAQSLVVQSNSRVVARRGDHTIARLQAQLKEERSKNNLLTHFTQALAMQRDKDIASVMNRLVNVATKLGREEAQRELLQHEVVELQSKLAKSKAEITDLRTSLFLSKVKLAAGEKALAETKTKNAKLEAKIEKSQQEVEETTKKLQSRLAEAKKASKEEIASLQEQLEEAQTKVHKYKKKKKKLEKSEAEIRKEVDEAKKKTSDVTNQMESTKRQAEEDRNALQKKYSGRSGGLKLIEKGVSVLINDDQVAL
jgi:chromosome segregation ATPase